MNPVQPGQIRYTDIGYPITALPATGPASHDTGACVFHRITWRTSNPEHECQSQETGGPSPPRPPHITSPLPALARRRSFPKEIPLVPPLVRPPFQPATKGDSSFSHYLVQDKTTCQPSPSLPGPSHALRLPITVSPKLIRIPQHAAGSFAPTTSVHHPTVTACPHSPRHPSFPPFDITHETPLCCPAPEHRPALLSNSRGRSDRTAG